MKTSIRAFAVLIGFLLAPFFAGGSVIVTGGLTYEFEAAAGGSLEGTIACSNPDDKPQEIKAYQTDYFFYADGTVLYGDPGKLPRSNARWISISPHQALIPPKESLSIHFSIQVPGDESMKGTYWSVIMIEPVEPGSVESTGGGPGDIGMGLRQVMRYAVQVVTHVGVSSTRQLKFPQIKLAAENEKKILVVDVENTGERWLRGTAWVELYDSKGKYTGKFEGGKQRMYPGTTARFKMDLVGILSDSYKALIVVDCGGNDVFGARVNLVLK